MTRKRADGEGTIYKEECSGLWTAALTVDGKRLVKRSKRQDVVRRWLAEMRAKADQGLIATAGQGLTLGQLLDQWFASRKPSWRGKTVVSYEAIIRLHLKPELGKLKLSTLRPHTLQVFYDKKLAAGSSARLVQLCHVTLHGALEYALKLDLVPRNVADATSPPRLAERHRVQAWTAEQARRFLTALRAGGDRLTAFFTLALTTGMRQGELCGLHWADVNLERATLQVRRQLQRIPGQGLIESAPKTAAGRRFIELTPTAVAALRAWQKQQQAEREATGDRWTESPYCFTSTTGGPLDSRNVAHRFRERVTALGLPVIRPHDLRHTCATLLLEENEHPKVVQELLGHAQIGLTLDTYSHVTQPMRQRAAAAMERVFHPPVAETTDGASVPAPGEQRAPATPGDSPASPAASPGSPA